MIEWSVALIGAIALPLRTVFRREGMVLFVGGGTLGISFLRCIVSVWLGMIVLDITTHPLTKVECMHRDVPSFSRLRQRDGG